MTHTDHKPLTSVHEALQNAVFAQKHPSGEVIALRIQPDLKKEAMNLCERHGTTLSEFLRQCVIGLLSDYSDPTRG